MEGFEIIKKLGEGTFSVVYKVRRKKDNITYALKKVKLQKLKEKEKENSLNEVRILASIKSPFVIGYKEAFIEEKDKSLCIVMEYANCGDLFQKINQYKKMNLHIEEADIWRIFLQILKGLKCLHDLKILHRDLKSANIFLFSDGTAKIGDCNVSKVVYKGLGYTQTGTPYYASPEVWSEEPYDNKSDIWSLGIIIYEMLALHPPFQANNMNNLYKKIIRGQYGKISNRYSDDIIDIVKLLLKVNPSKRPSCEEILKIGSVIERVDFFKDREGFKEDSFDTMDDMKLLKTLRVTNDLLFLSKQLPAQNYDNSKNNKLKGNRSNKNYNSISKISINCTLPSITNSTNLNISREENKVTISATSRKIFSKYKINTNNINRDSSLSHNESQNNLLMKTENVDSPTKNKTIFQKDLYKSNNYSINNRLNYQSIETNKRTRFMKNIKSANKRNIYLLYENGGRRNNKYSFRSPKKRAQFLPNIFGNKSKKRK